MPLLLDEMRPAFFVCLALVFLSCHAAAKLPSAVPIIVYTDILSGPNSGGENNKGIYLSIFGKNFGATGLGTTVKVFVNGVEVDNYRYLGRSKGRPDIQQISVQIGPIGNPEPGVELPVKVTVNGVASNTDRTFTVSKGNIYFVNNVSGTDTADLHTGGSFTSPFRNVQKKTGARLGFSIEPAAIAGAWGRVQAGDFIVMRGSGTPWIDVGFGGYFLQALNKSGCPIGTNCAQGGGKSAGPITLMGFPGEDVYINNAYDPALDFGAISSADSARVEQGMGTWITITNLRIEGGNHDGAVNTQAGGSHWRVVNNELSAASAVKNVNAKSGGIAGSGVGQHFLGNYIHNIFCGPAGRGPMQNHGIYIDGDGTYEIAYNLVEKIPGGNGFQTFVNRSTTVNNINLHHNVIRDTGKHGINLADGTGMGINIYNNLVHGTDMAGLRMNSPTLTGARIYNNTFFNSDRMQAGGTRAMLMNDANLIVDSAEIRNNIFVPGGAKRNYAGGSVGFGSIASTMSHNLWFDGKNCLVNLPFNSKGCTIGSHNVSGDPLFASTSAGMENFRLRPGSAAIDAGTSATPQFLADDIDITITRPQGALIDIGAHEFIQ